MVSLIWIKLHALAYNPLVYDAVIQNSTRVVYHCHYLDGHSADTKLHSAIFQAAFHLSIAGFP